jgi:hypothetical protein
LNWCPLTMSSVSCPSPAPRLTHLTQTQHSFVINKLCIHRSFGSLSAQAEFESLSLSRAFFDLLLWALPNIPLADFSQIQ